MPVGVPRNLQIRPSFSSHAILKCSSSLSDSSMAFVARGSPFLNGPKRSITRKWFDCIFGCYCQRVKISCQINHWELIKTARSPDDMYMYFMRLRRFSRFNCSVKLSWVRKINRLTNWVITSTPVCCVWRQTDIKFIFTMSTSWHSPATSPRLTSSLWWQGLGNPRGTSPSTSLAAIFLVTAAALSATPRVGESV